MQQPYLGETWSERDHDGIDICCTCNRFMRTREGIFEKYAFLWKWEHFFGNKFFSVSAGFPIEIHVKIGQLSELTPHPLRGLR